jgi:hypothetical protein
MERDLFDISSLEEFGLVLPDARTETIESSIVFDRLGTILLKIVIDRRPSSFPLRHWFFRWLKKEFLYDGSDDPH